MSVEPTVNGDVKHAAVPVAGPVRPIERRSASLPVPGGAVAVAAGSIGTVMLLGALRRLSRRSGRRAGRGRRRELRRSVLGTRSFLVDVHFLGR